MEKGIYLIDIYLIDTSLMQLYMDFTMSIRSDDNVLYCDRSTPGSAQKE